MLRDIEWRDIELRDIECTHLPLDFLAICERKVVGKC